MVSAEIMQTYYVAIGNNFYFIERLKEDVPRKVSIDEMNYKCNNPDELCKFTINFQ